MFDSRNGQIKTSGPCHKLNNTLKHTLLWAGVLVLWLWEEKVMGSHPSNRILDGHFSHKFVVKIEIFV